MSQQRQNREQRRQPSRAAEQLPSQIQASYTKSGFSRVSHVDGVFGGLTPHGLVYMAFFSEHAKIPATAEFAVDPAARTIREVNQPDRVGGWVREVEAEIIIGVDFARALRTWLDVRIKQFEQNRPEDTLTSAEGQQS